MILLLEDVQNDGIFRVYETSNPQCAYYMEYHNTVGFGPGDQVFVVDDITFYVIKNSLALPEYIQVEDGQSDTVETIEVEDYEVAKHCITRRLIG